MRTKIAVLVVALQVLVLGFMAGEREWIVRTGRQILLRTAPIDPNDPMRGFYARLNYDISSVPRPLWRGGLAARAAINTYDYRGWRDLRVYALLEEDDSGVARLVALTDEKPKDGFFLQGRVNQFQGGSLTVRYGVEAMFMQQGKSQKLEDARNQDRRGAQIDAEIAVSSSGVAVLKGYHWEPLGLAATFERASVPIPNFGQPNPRGPAPQRQVVVAVKLEFKNYSDKDVAIVDAPGGGSFRMVSVAMGGMETRYRWAGENRTASKPDAASVIVLKPGATHSTRIDLTRPEWFVVETKSVPGRGAPANPTPVALRDVTDVWAASFRLEYVPPNKAASVGLPHAEIIHHGHLLSRVFNGGTGVD
jgi:uncharacterized membrane-anchored protein